MAQYPVRSDTRENLLSEVRITTDGANDPSYDDPGGIVKTIAGPGASGGPGRFNISLHDGYQSVMGVSGIDRADDIITNVGGATSSVVTVITQQIDIAGGAVVAVDTSNRLITVLLHLQR